MLFRFMIFLLLLPSLLVGFSSGATPLGETMKALAASIQSVVPPTDNSQAMAAMTAAGLQEAEEQVEDVQGSTLLERVVRTLVGARLNTHFLTGGCHRNYTVPCPSGWTYSETENTCAPPSSGDTSLPMDCEVLNLDRIESVKKPDFALRCRTQWPCVACERDFTKCPFQWVSVDDGCAPLPEYIGPCDQAVNFSKLKTDIDKARWAALCYAEWPCKPE